MGSEMIGDRLLGGEGKSDSGDLTGEGVGQLESGNVGEVGPGPSLTLVRPHR